MQAVQAKHPSARCERAAVELLMCPLGCPCVVQILMTVHFKPSTGHPAASSHSLERHKATRPLQFSVPHVSHLLSACYHQSIAIPEARAQIPNWCVTNTALICMTVHTSVKMTVHTSVKMTVHTSVNRYP